MTTGVVTIGAGATVQEAARVMAERRVSGLPVLDENGLLAGIVSEGDLVRRAELGTHDDGGSWWLKVLAENTARDYVKSHARAVKDVMTRPALTVRPRTRLAEVARLMQEHGVKRLPVVEDGRLVGAAHHADLVRALAAQGGGPR